MLQSIRSVIGSKVGSVIAKVLFALLIVAFGSWGVGDFVRQRPQADAVITVGSKTVSPGEFQRAVQREIDRARQQGLTLTTEQLRQFGLLDRITSQLADGAVLDETAHDESIEVGPQQVLAALEAEPAFRGTDGKFDPKLAKSLLAANGLTEQQFEADIAEHLPQSILVTPTADAKAPALLGDILFKIRQETRIADYVSLPAKDLKDLPAPDAGAIQDYYDHHHESFTAPEYRSFSLLAMRLDTVAAGINASDDQLKDAYQQRADELKQPERRHLLQMLLPDQKTADAASAELTAGKDFKDVAARLAHQDAASVDLDWVTQKDLPQALAAASFAAKENEVTKPIPSPLGFTVAKVVGIRPAGILSFDEAKPKLTELVRTDQASEELYKLTSKVEDALAGGVDLAAIADQYGFKLISVPSTDGQGLQPNGKPLDDLGLDKTAVLKAAFATGQGQSSSLQEEPGGKNFFVVKVTGITAPVLRPFDSVKDAVRDAVMAERRSAAVVARAKALAAQIKPEFSLAQLAAREHLAVATTLPLLRTDNGRQTGLPASAIALIFKQKPGDAAAVDNGGDAWIVQLREIQQPDPATQQAALATLRTQLQQTAADEAFVAFTEQLKERHPVEIHQAVIDQLYPPTQP